MVHKLKIKKNGSKALKDIQKDNNPDTQTSIWDLDFYILHPDHSSLHCLFFFQALV